MNNGTSCKIHHIIVLYALCQCNALKFKLHWHQRPPECFLQPRRMLEVSRAEKEFGFKAKTSFEEGLRKTIDWYLSNKLNRS